MRRAMAVAATAVVLLAFSLSLSGCGGGGGPAEPQPPAPPSGTAVIQGYVVNAAAPSNRVPYAVVTPTPPGTGTTADSSGSFRITGLPAGTIVLTVAPGPSGAFWPAQLAVATQNGKTTYVVAALIPHAVSTPTQLQLTPTSVTLDPGGTTRFTAEVYAGLTKLNVVPTWVIENAVGVISPEGDFVATAQGTGAVVAWAGSQSARATVVVTGPRPPTIWSVFIDPEELSYSGGDVRFTLHVSDGDGIDYVRAEIYRPGQVIPDTQDLTRVAGTDRDGTWTAVRSLPPNDLPYDSLGNQPDEVYDVRFRVKDQSGLTGNDTTVTGFYEVRVRGAEAPPPPPPPG